MIANPEKAKQDADDLKNQLPESWQKKFDKALAARIAVEIADMQRQFEEQLREAKEQLAVKLEEAEAERAAAFTAAPARRFQSDTASNFRYPPRRNEKCWPRGLRPRPVA